jgi:hypothetical protein
MLSLFIAFFLFSCSTFSLFLLWPPFLLSIFHDFSIWRRGFCLKYFSIIVFSFLILIFEGCINLDRKLFKCWTPTSLCLICEAKIESWVVFYRDERVIFKVLKRLVESMFFVWILGEFKELKLDSLHHNCD